MTISLCARSDGPQLRAACAQEVVLLRESYSAQSSTLRLIVWFSLSLYGLKRTFQQRESRSAVRIELGTSFRPVDCSLRLVLYLGVKSCIWASNSPGKCPRTHPARPRREFGRGRSWTSMGVLMDPPLRTRWKRRTKTQLRGGRCPRRS